MHVVPPYTHSWYGKRAPYSPFATSVDIPLRQYPWVCLILKLWIRLMYGVRTLFWRRVSRAAGNLRIQSPTGCTSFSLHSTNADIRLHIKVQISLCSIDGNPNALSSTELDEPTLWELSNYADRGGAASQAKVNLVHFGYKHYSFWHLSVIYKAGNAQGKEVWTQCRADVHCMTWMKVQTSGFVHQKSFKTSITFHCTWNENALNC